jgi:ATP/maltotriose-dependent transcriptional regulator MalT/two-component SAPR family response regulator
LFSVLDQRQHASVLWVWGPPGSGKTTLVASYLESRDLDSHWYQLDAGDSDVATFFYFMGLAVTRTRGESDESLPLYTSEYRRDLDAFSRNYFQNLYAPLESPFALVLDNYQEVSPQSAFHSAILSAVADLPPHGCIIAISRSEPPASMVRLRANQALQMLGWNDLRLTRTESDAIVRLWGADIDEAGLEQIYEKTQGWPAGLILMLDQATATGTMTELPVASAPQLIFDYLAGEVFQKFDDATRQLLLTTAFLPEVTESMAVEISGDPGAGDILAGLYRGNYYVSMKPGSTEPVYAYHPLFREFLVTRTAEALGEVRRQRLRRRTAAILEREGMVGEAIDLLNQDQDWLESKRLMLEHAAEMLAHGRAETLENWIDEFPEAALEDDPWLHYWRAACRFLTSQRESRFLYEEAFALFSTRAPGDREGLLLSCAGAMDSIIHELDDFSLLDRWIEHAGSLLASTRWHSRKHEHTEAEARATVSLFVSLALRQPHHPDIKQWSERARRLSGQLTDAMSRVSAQLLVAINLNYTGQFSHVEELVAEMRAACDSPNVPPLALTILNDIEALYYMLTGDRDACLEAVYAGIEIAESSGVDAWGTHLLSNGVGGALGAGDLDAAEELLTKMREGARGYRRLDLCNLHYYSAWLNTLREDYVGAHRELKTALRLATETGCPFYVMLCRVAMAQVLAELGDERRAASQLRRVHEGARDISNPLFEFMSLLVYAHIALEHGRERSGLNSLRYAMGVGRENGFMHFLWWQPTMMAKLCVRALNAGIEVEYVKDLIRRRNLMPEDPPLEVEEWPWPFQIRAFGRFEVTRDGKPMGFFAKLQGKPMELLKALVGFGGDDIQEVKIAESMWPRIDGDYAQRSLTTTLHRLRKNLGIDQAVALRNGRLALDPRLCWLDLRAFEEVTRKIDSCLKSASASVSLECVNRLQERLLGLYRGPFMASEGDDPRYVGLRERLRTRFERCVGELARYFESLGDWEQAIDCYTRSLEVDELAEAFYRKLMLCYREMGRQAEAVDVYNACKRIFNAELNIEPSPETKAVYERVLSEL